MRLYLYDLFMALGAGLVVAGVACLAGLGASLVAAGSLMMALTWLGARH